MVNVNRTQKYTSKMGQNTGMSNTRNNVHMNAITIERVAECLQNRKDPKKKVAESIRDPWFRLERTFFGSVLFFLELAI